jgi:phosphoribosylformylglycinamidine synthase
MHNVNILVTPRKSIPNPAGNAVENALHKLGFANVKNVSVGKLITFDIENTDEDSVKPIVEKMCEKLLVSNATENFRIEINTNECLCPNTSCENHSNCRACVKHHAARDYPPFCLRK